MKAPRIYTTWDGPSAWMAAHPFHAGCWNSGVRVVFSFETWPDGHWAVSAISAGPGKLRDLDRFPSDAEAIAWLLEGERKAKKRKKR